MNSQKCPSDRQLLALAQGTLDESEANSLEDHLAICVKCGSTIGLIDEGDERSDTVVRCLASLPGSDDDEPAYRELYHQLLAQSVPFTGTAHTATRSFWPPQNFDRDPWTLPRRLGSYELNERIGGGAYGSVYRGRHLNLERPVVIKVLSSHVADSDAVGQFWNEFKAIGRLDHPHIVRATDAGEVEGIHFLVMEYDRGIDLSTLLRQLQDQAAIAPLRDPGDVAASGVAEANQSATLPPSRSRGSRLLRVADACEMVRQAASGLAFAHANGLVHRDVKPANMLFTASGRVRLLDLGLAAFLDRTNDEFPAAEVQSPRGTADYMAPEQWTNFSRVDCRADIYSLGCSLFKLLTGDPPFRASAVEVGSKRLAHQRAPIPRLRESRPDCPELLDAVVQRMLAKSADERFGSATDLARAIEPFCAGADLVALAVSVFGEQALAAPTGPACDRVALPAPTTALSDQTAAATANAYPVAPHLASSPATVHQVPQAAGYGNVASSGKSRRVARWLWPTLLVSAAVLLAATAYRWLPERDIETGVWRELSLATPRRIFSLDRDPPTLEVSRDARRLLRVTSQEFSLFHFGQPVKGTFTFAVGMEQKSGDGGIGIFFAFRSTEIDPDNVPQARCREFQTLELSPAPGRELQWCRYRYDLRDPRPSLTRHLLASTNLDRPLPSAAAARGIAENVERSADDLPPASEADGALPGGQLSVTLGEAGFPDVSWNGIPLPQSRWQLSADARDYAFLNPQQASVAFAGRIGVVNHKGTADFREAKLKYR